MKRTKPKHERLDAELLRPSGALLSAHIALSSAIEREAVACTGHDSTTLDLLVRLDLAPNRQLRAVELCRQLQLSPSYISRMIDRAEEEGLVQRGTDPCDRRAHLITMTDRGQAVVADFAPRLHAVLERVIYGALEPGEIDSLVALVGRITAAAGPCRDHS